MNISGLDSYTERLTVETVFVSYEEEFMKLLLFHLKLTVKFLRILFRNYSTKCDKLTIKEKWLSVLNFYYFLI